MCICIRLRQKSDQTFLKCNKNLDYKKNKNKDKKEMCMMK